MAALRKKSFCVLEYPTSKSVFTVQRAFRAKYAKDRPTDKTIPSGRTDQNVYTVPNFLIYFYFVKIPQNMNRYTKYA